MRQRWVATIAAGLLATGCGSGGGPRPAPSADQAVRDFVVPTYAHGVPYDDARALGPQAVKILLQLLDEPGMVMNRSNIVVSLGMLGSDPAEQRLIGFIAAGSGPLTADDVSLRLDALTALGYAANVASTATTLDYLIGGLVPDEWASRVKWQLPTKGSPAARLRQQTVAALGLSGKQAALRALQNLEASGGRGGRGGGSPVTTPSEQAQIVEAIKANQFIAANGLSQYYRTFLPR